MNKWISISLISKLSDGWIRELRFSLWLYKKLLVYWSDDKKLLSRMDVIG